MRSRRDAVAVLSVAAALFGLAGLATPGTAQAATTAASASPASASAPGHAPAAAGAASGSPASTAPVKLPSGAKEKCPKPTSLLQEQCQSFGFPRKMKAATTASPTANEPLTPADLQSAYGVTSASASAGTGETVAIVDAYGDSTAKSDLEQYRSKYGLGCTDGSCLHVYNENGGTSLPADPTGNNGGWRSETSLDLDMVSALCPNCGIDLFEANSASTADLGTAENAAVSKGDKFISNSWSGADFAGESAYDSQYFDHPGVAMVFASGDNGYAKGGYEASYPASSQYVTSVGGTYLSGSAGSWSQTVWNDDNGATASGCSSGEGKPAWQADAGCANRTQNDVAGVADSPDGIDIYSSYDGGEVQVGGTSAAAPAIAAMYALAGTPEADTYPSSYLYAHASDLTRVTSGSNGSCESARAYLCNAASSESNGYNGPTGLGVPNGSLAPFTAPSGNVVTLPNPGTYDLQTGVQYTFPAFGTTDSDSAQTFTYSASNLPSGLTINQGTGVISGEVGSPEDQTVKVTATDTTGASATIAFNISAMGSMTTSYHAVSGEVPLDWDGKCLDDSGDSSANGAKAIVWQCSSTDKAQNSWAFQTLSDPAHADIGQIKINGKCLDEPSGDTGNGAEIDLQPCASASHDEWEIVGVDGELVNAMSGRCLEDPGWSQTNGTQLDVWSCTTGANQDWTLPASPIDSAMYDRCLNDNGNSTANGTVMISYTCDGSAPEKWAIEADGTIRIYGKCLDDKSSGINDGTVVDLYSCNGTLAQQWELTSWGQIESANAEKCLSIPNDNNANAVTLQDCTGKRGEVWAAS